MAGTCASVGLVTPHLNFCGSSGTMKYEAEDQIYVEEPCVHKISIFCVSVHLNHRGLPIVSVYLWTSFNDVAL